MASNIRGLLNQLSVKYDMRSLIFWEVAFGMVLSVFLMFMFLSVSSAVLDNQTLNFDTTISQVIYAQRQPWLKNPMIIVSLMGEQMIIVLAILIVALLTSKKHKKESMVFLILLVMGLIATSLLKLFFKVPRPDGFALVPVNSYSFPSGHALNSMLFYGVLAYFAFHFTKSKKISAIALVGFLMIVFLIGVSRIYLGVHRPSDVIAGYIFGFWLMITVILIDKTITYFKLINEPKNSQPQPK